MTVEHRKGHNGAKYTVSTVCPFCGDDLPEQVGLATHIRTKCEEAE